MAEQTLRQRIETIIGGNQAQQAFRIREEVKALIEKFSDDPAKQDSLSRLYTQLSLVAVMRLSDQELFTLFEQNAGYLMYAPPSINIVENIKDHLALEFFVEDRNDIRDNLIAALQRCDDRVTEQKIYLGQEEVAPTVSNWIKEYVAEVGNEAAARVAIARFFSQNRNVQRLSTREQAAVRRLIDLYEYLKLRSDSQQGYETERLYQKLDGSMYRVADGDVELLFDKSDLREARDKFRAGDIGSYEFWKMLQYFPEEEVQSEWNEYNNAVGANTPQVSLQDVQSDTAIFFDEQMKKFGANILEVSEESSQSLINKLLLSLKEPSTTQQVQNTVFSLAQSPEMLARVLKNTQVIEYLDAQAQTRLDDNNRAIFDQSKVSPVAFQLLLESVFEDKLRLTSEEAKWRSYEICRSLPFELRDFKTVVSYDVRTNALSYRYA